MKPPSLAVIDTGAFPVVQIHGAALAPGDGLRIISDLEALLRHAVPFALVIINGDAAAPRQHDEDKARMLWLKENKARLASVCRGIISVVPDDEQLLRVRKQAAGMQTALELRFAVSESLAAALAAAAMLLQQD